MALVPSGPEVPSAGADLDGPFVFLPEPGRVVLVTRRCCGVERGREAVVVFTSVNGGQTFDGGQVVGNASVSGDVIYGPGPSAAITAISTGSEVVGPRVSRMPFGLYSSDAAMLSLGAQHGSGAALALIDGTTPIAVYTRWGDAVGLFARVYTGPGDYNAGASWSAEVPIDAGLEPHLAASSRGVFLLYSVSAEPNFLRVYVVRRWTGSTFGAPTTVTEVGAPTAATLAADARGGLHAAWRDAAGAIRARSASDATAWAPARAVATDPRARRIALAAAPDGGGLVVWDQTGTDGHVRAASLELGVTAGTATRRTPLRVGRVRVTLSSPQGCVPRADRVRVTVSIPRAARTGARVVFTLGGRAVVDRAAPFTADLRIDDLTPGIRRTIGARVTVGRATRTARADFAFC